MIKLFHIVKRNGESIPAVTLTLNVARIMSWLNTTKLTVAYIDQFTVADGSCLGGGHTHHNKLGLLPDRDTAALPEEKRVSNNQRPQISCTRYHHRHTTHLSGAPG